MRIMEDGLLFGDFDESNCFHMKNLQLRQI